LHWDFALIFFILAFVVPALGRRRVRVLLELPDTAKSDRLSLYASTIVLQWLFAAVIVWRASRHAILSAQMGFGLGAVPTTITISIVFSIAVLAFQLIGLRRLDSDPGALAGETVQVALKVFPRDGVERVCFTALVCTVAICEEFIYRGFAQYVFQAWSGSLAVGIVGSALLFSIAHLYQGKRGLVSTFGAGALFAGVRAWTGSLVPTISAHFVADLTIGLLAPRRILAALAKAPTGRSVSPEQSISSSGTIPK
jgi:membrane protease YdiL (CAAX protease family)